MTPRRIQRRRTKGSKMQEGAVYVGRGSKFGNEHDWRNFVDNNFPDKYDNVLAKAWAVRCFAMAECRQCFEKGFVMNRLYRLLPSAACFVGSSLGATLYSYFDPSTPRIYVFACLLFISYGTLLSIQDLRDRP